MRALLLLAALFTVANAVLVNIFIDANCVTPPPPSTGYGNQAPAGNQLPPSFTIFADMCHAFLGGATDFNSNEVATQYNGMALDKCSSAEVVVNLFSAVGRPPIFWGVPRDTCSTAVDQKVALTPGVCTPVSAWARSSGAPLMYWQISDLSCDPPAPVYTLSLARNQGGTQPCTAFANPAGNVGGELPAPPLLLPTVCISQLFPLLNISHSLQATLFCRARSPLALAPAPQTSLCGRP